MLVSVKWLRDYADIDMDVKEFADMMREILYPSVRLEYSDIDILEKEMLKGDAKE